MPNRLLPAALAVALLSACPQPIQTQCGKPGESCCAGGGCNSGLECGADDHCRVCGGEGEGCCGGTGCNAGLRCGEGAICRACGGQNEGCCAGSACDMGLECFEDEVCRACGRLDQECCAGGLCISGLECAADNHCKACGADGQLCCSGDRCAAGNECRPDGLCHTCGALGQGCCAGQSCNTGLRCDINQCVAPCGEGCAPGAKQCSANGGVDLCTYTSPPCTAWSTVLERCPEEQVCRDGVCQARCPDACTLGSTLCTSEGLKLCELDTTTQCPVYRVAPASPDNPSCMTGACDGSICWEGPLPQGNELVGVTGWAEDRLKVLDELGNVLSLDGTAWSYEWRAANASDRVRDLASCAGYSMMAVGVYGLAITRSSTGWTRESIGSNEDLAGVGCGANRLALAVGREGLLVARERDPLGEQAPGKWRELTSPTTADLNDAAIYSSDGWAVGDGGTIVRCANLEVPASTDCQLEGVGVTTADLHAIWINTLGHPDTGQGAGEMVAVGSGGVVLRRSPGAAGTWSREASGLTSRLLTAVWGLPTGDVYVAGDAGTFLYRAGFGSTFKSASFTSTPLWGVYASDETHLFVVGDGGELWFNDVRGFPGQPPTKSWRQLGGDKPTTAFLNSVDGNGASDVYAVGTGGAVVHKSGDAWRREAVGLTTVELNSVLAVSENEVYAFGDEGTILTRRNGIWSREGAGVTTNSLRASFADSKTVYAVGEGGTWLEKPRGASGSMWHLENRNGLLPDAAFLAMAGNESEVWAVGYACTALRKSGTTFTVETIEACDGENLTAIWMGADGEMFLGGDAFSTNLLLHRVGGRWGREYAGLDPINAFAVEGADVWVLHSAGELRHRVAGNWILESPRLTYRTLTAAYAAPEGDVYMVGGNGLIWHRR